jgi:hypothetical protein
MIVFFAQQREGISRLLFVSPLPDIIPLILENDGLLFFTRARLLHL